MIKNPLVTVIITTYKRELFFKKTLKSIIEQTYSNLEIIVVNDDNVNSIKKLIDSFNDKRIILYEIKHSGRPAVPRNFGIKKASGDLIAFCDDDDLWEKDKIEQQVIVLQENPEVYICHTNNQFIDENDNPFEQTESSQRKTNISFEEQLLKNYVTFSSAIVRADLFKNDMFFFNEDLKLKASEDYLFFLKIIYFHKSFYIPKKLIKYRIHKNGISYIRGKNIKLISYLTRIVRCLLDLKKINMINNKIFFQTIKHHFLNVLKQILYNTLKRFYVFS